jgi:hypothetical protein
MKTLKILAVTVLLTAISHTVMAQCSCSAYVYPTTTDCSYVGLSCDSGGAQINGHNICSSGPSGGTNCISHDAVVGVIKTCTQHINYWAELACAGEAGGCLYVCVSDPPACLPCLMALGGASGMGGSCMFCGNIITCTESDQDIHDQVYDSSPGTCPQNG